MVQLVSRVLFQTPSHGVPKNYKKWPFYFWFYTGFVEEGTLVLGREELDNPHKSKTWHCFERASRWSSDLSTARSSRVPILRDLS